MTQCIATAATPAQVLGVDDRVGDIAPGYLANLIVLDEHGAVQEIIHRGHTIERS